MDKVLSAPINGRNPKDGKTGDVTVVKRECLILFWGCIALRAVMLFCFISLGIKWMAGMSITSIIAYLFGTWRIHKSSHTRRWIYLFAGEFILNAVVCNLVIGWGYGYLLYNIMLIPIVYYFLYLADERLKSNTALRISIASSIILAFSCILMGEFNRVTWVGEKYVLAMYTANAIFCSIVLIFYSARFISEIQKKTRYLEYYADYDELTGVLNRKGFIDKTTEMIKNHPEVPFIMLCSDIKDFKMINEIFGEEECNKVLIKQAELIKSHMEPMSVLGRVSGDRFALCLPKRFYKESQFVEDVATMKKTFSTGLYQMYIYVGAYEIQDIDEPVSVMLDKANMAIQSIKGDYHRIVAYYDNAILESELEKKKLIAEFDNALERGEFCMFLQPQTGADGKCHGAEALVRWKHGKRGLLFPDSFVKCYEDAGLIHKLDAYVWELAAMQLKLWKDMGREDLHISINISAKDFFYLDVYSTLKGLVDKYGIAVQNLRLELTETAIVTEGDNMEMIAKLHDDGFIIEIDDFGSGYSSLNMLKDIRADVLKIDREFLRETEGVTRSRDILEGIISLSNRMNMTVITEGVETREQVDMLTNMGCNVFQGYYFSKPIPVVEFEEKYCIA